ncbi:EAL domain-containing protein [Ahrensia kielensis]|uniref:EAL domain-containing protein n=1 Tax=Ahrensia kielensis TaxID=76980 RepID=A0ABU9T9F3_9HYPH
MIEEFTIERIMEVSGVGGWQLDLKNNKLEWTSQTKRIHGVPLDYEPKIETAIEFYHPDDRAIITKAVTAAIEKHASWDLKLRLIRADGEQIRVRTFGEVKTDLHDTPRVFGTIQNIEDTERELNKLQSIFDNVDHGLNVFDAEGRLRFWNQQYLDLFNKPEGEIYEGMTLQEILSCEFERGDFVGDPKIFSEALLEDMAANRGTVQTGTINGFRTIQTINRPLPEGGWVCTHHDISEAKQAETKLAYAAHHDSLTSLLNRHAFENEFKELIESHLNVVMVIIDLDDFKPVNDQYGHASGDQLLKLFAFRMSEHYGELAIVARLGGDEFAVAYVTKNIDVEKVKADLTKLQANLMREALIRGQTIKPAASIGCAFGQGGKITREELFHQADMAMYRAKARGGNSFEIFDERMAAELKLRDEENHAIIEACRNNQLEFHFQPICSFQTGARIGFEMLVRWPEKNDLWFPADRIISVAEENRLIDLLGKYAISCALSNIKAYGLTEKVSVNVSPLQLGKGELLAHVKAAIKRTGVNPAQLELELTESSVLLDVNGAMEELIEIKKLGITIAIDDFGTGFATLDYLNMFPFDRLKIDRSFVLKLLRDQQSGAIISAVAALARNIGMETTAEGVETQEQYDILRASGCTHAQGYLLGKPAPLSVFFNHETKLYA